MTHTGHLVGAWPTGCPLPPENPDRLEGPELGAEVIYRHTSRTGQGYPTVWTEVEHVQPAIVEARSYVWSPGECRSNGGYRHYDWSVIRTWHEDGREYTVVVNDTDLSDEGQFEFLNLKMELGLASQQEIAKRDELLADRNEAIVEAIQPGTWQVIFMYTDEYEEAQETPGLYDAQQTAFASKAEADAFVMGIEWGDEPKFKSLGVTNLAG